MLVKVLLDPRTGYVECHSVTHLGQIQLSTIDPYLTKYIVRLSFLVQVSLKMVFPFNKFQYPTVDLKGRLQFCSLDNLEIFVIIRFIMFGIN